MSKKALITGITGQDGSFLAEFLLGKGYEVHGITRRSSLANTGRIDHLLEKHAVTLHDGDLSDSSSLIRIIGEVQPDEIYNLAAQSPCTGKLRCTGVFRRCRRTWRLKNSGGGQNHRSYQENEDLSGIHF